MEDGESLDPLIPKGTTVGIIYNLKKGIKSEAEDAEAEYDNVETVYAIRRALERYGAKTELFEADETLSEKLRGKHIDIAFNIAEGVRGRGREAEVPAVLNMLGIPFTGSDETTLCVALDKALTKRLLSTYFVRTPKYIVVEGAIPNLNKLSFPVIVKPNAEGSSKGISDVSVVNDKKELKALLERNLKLYSGAMLVEEYIDGREFTVGMLGNGEKTHVFRPMEISYRLKTQGDYCVYSFGVKKNYKKYIDYKCPSDIGAEIEEEMIRVASKVYKALGCLDFARMDFRVSADGKVYFIEINPLPGLAPGYSDYPMLAEFCGVEYDRLVAGIMQTALIRHGFQIGRRGA